MIIRWRIHDCIAFLGVAGWARRGRRRGLFGGAANLRLHVGGGAIWSRVGRGFTRRGVQGRAMGALSASFGWRQGLEERAGVGRGGGLGGGGDIV